MKKILKTIIITVIPVIILFSPNKFFAQPSSNETLILDKKLLEKLRISFEEKEKSYQPVVKKIIDDANKLLKQKSLSIIDKSVTPPSGDKHDYMSMGPYWWPDPTKKDGLPYIRRDGERNPEYHKITDHEYITRTMSESEILAVAYFITHDSKYSRKAVEKIRVWFLDDETRMNPNMKHAQFIPGINTGRGIGLIETRDFYNVLDAVILLRNSVEWKKEDDNKFNEWLEEYFKWITADQYGLDESKEKNNHGTWYDVQVVSIALFLNKIEFAKKVIEESKEKRIGAQIEPDGQQTLELARTKSWEYSCMNLSGFMHLALLAEHVNVDLWNYQSPRGGSIRKAFDYLLPFTKNFGAWEYKQITTVHKEDFIPILSMTEKKYKINIESELNKMIVDNNPEVVISILHW